IGGGEGGDGANVSITGGTVHASAGSGDTGNRAIGPGYGSDEYGSLTLGDLLMVWSERMAVTAERVPMCWYRTDVHVEPCDHSDGFTYTIDGTTSADHHISHCPYCNHSDTALHTFDEHGVCTVCGAQASAYTVQLYMPHDQGDGSFDGQTYDCIATHLVVPGSSYILPLATLKVPGLRFAGWEATTAPTGATYTSPYTTATADTLYRTGNRYTISANISFVARYSGLNITLLDDAGNGETLSRYDGMQAASVTLSGRTLYKDNDWNTLCLPFSLASLEDTPLAGATLMELDTEGTYDTDKQTGFDPNTGTLYLYFKSATGIEAGKPYIIKWTSGDNIENPVFENVTISNLTSDVSAPYLTFKGTYSRLQYTEEDRKLLFLGTGNQLHFPDGEGTTNIGSCRAYFRVQELLLSASLAAPLRIVMNLDADHTATALENALPEGQRGLKLFRDGRIYILRDGITYDILGRKITH
ncbi:MAG: hypothetical protein J6T19_08090, partial [Paludibacteraceae bacterium]|nr:hypothetical protein [Paludibacteraceae bacterium]